MTIGTPLGRLPAPTVRAPGSPILGAVRRLGRREAAPIPSPRAPALAAGSWAQVSGTAGTPGLNLRAAPSAAERQLAVLPEGQKANLLEGPVTGANGDPWYRVAWNGSGGWVDGITGG